MMSMVVMLVVVVVVLMMVLLRVGVLMRMMVVLSLLRLVDTLSASERGSVSVADALAMVGMMRECCRGR